MGFRQACENLPLTTKGGPASQGCRAAFIKLNLVDADIHKSTLDCLTDK